MFLLQWAFAIIPLINLNRAQDCQECSCGFSISDRIVGGSAVDINKYPWMAMVLYNGNFLCGGSSINNKYVLTAAHCILTLQLSSYEVRFLQNRLGPPDPNTIIRQISQIIQHNYNTNTKHNDIALLKLSQSIQFNEWLRPVCLPPQGRSFVGRNSIVIGWGLDKETGKMSRWLQEVTIPVKANQECHTSGLRLTDGMMCAGALGKDACGGDSGGPLHVVRKGKFTQVGIVSWGSGCGGPEVAGVYAQVSSYLIWIQQNTNDACTCE